MRKIGFAKLGVGMFRITCLFFCMGLAHGVYLKTGDDFYNLVYGNGSEDGFEFRVTYGVTSNDQSFPRIRIPEKFNTADCKVKLATIHFPKIRKKVSSPKISGKVANVDIRNHEILIETNTRSGVKSRCLVIVERGDTVITMVDYNNLAK